MRDEDGVDIGRTFGDVAQEIGGAFVHLASHPFVERQSSAHDDWDACKLANDDIVIIVRLPKDKE